MTVDNMKLENEFEVPVIDLAGIQSPDLKSISEQIAKASEEWGFFQIINHVVDPSLMERTEKVYKEFFHVPAEKNQNFLSMEDLEAWSSPQVPDAVGKISGTVAPRDL